MFRTDSILGMRNILKEYYIKFGKKTHLGMIFNHGRGACGLSEYKYETSWHVEEVDCLKCLKYYISYDLENKYKQIAQKQYNTLIYRKEFEKLIK